MRIRQATDADVGALVALWQAAGMLAYTPDPRGTWSRPGPPIRACS
ncbi:MAG: hypothetical protein M3276_07840 [Actinomycetota bacterium]|nr:hypothetical protein [Actinomycetota bacterium]